MDIINLYRSILRRKWLILFCSILAAILAFVYAKFKTKLYASKAQYSTGLTIESVTVSDNFNVFQIDAKFSNIIETFKSPNVIGLLSYRLLANDLTSKQPFRKLDAKQETAFKSVGITKERAVRILLNKLDSLKLLRTNDPEENKLNDVLEIYKYDYKSLSGVIGVSRLQRTDYIDIYAETNSPELSAFLVNEIGASFLNFYNSLSNVRSSESISNLERQVSSKSKQFDSIYNSLQNTKQGSVGDISAQITSLMGIIQSYEEKLGEEKASLNRQTAQLNNLNNQIAALQKPVQTEPSSNNADAIAALRTQIRDLETEKASNPAQASTIDAKIKLLQREIAIKSKKPAGPKIDEALLADLKQKKYDAEAEVESAGKNIKEFEGTIRKYQGQISGLAGKDVGIAKEEAMAEMTSKELASIKDRFETVQGKKEGVGMNFKQTLFGQPSLEYESTRPILTTALSGASVFLTLCFIFLFLELLNPSLRTLVAFERELKLTPLVVLAKVNFKKESLGNVLSNTTSAPKKDRKLLLRFRTVIQLLRLKILESKKRVYLLSSYQSGEGKSLLIEALAKSLQMTGKSVLIVDANVMSNGLTEKYNAKPELIALLNGETTLENAVTKTEEEGIDIIGSSNTSSTFAELVSKNHQGIKSVFEASGYDYVLIEAPVMKYHIGVFELNDSVDGILNVVSADSVIDADYKAAMEKLYANREHFVGMVFNQVLHDNMPSS
ncbi:MAG TPA: Wzz/FepE/Etk N-terminal domain-containing protein [Phnomibacter sp.]|nr:Wzz/FepE/Etk N-terminal domain-containing protein [Phnomibacter sp.]